MLAPFIDEHWVNADGFPAGGVSTGTGVCISWQNGPLGRGNDRHAPNGAFVETVLAMVKQRIEFYETGTGGRFACEENKQALVHIAAALQVLDTRTKAREARGVEGTHTR